MKITRPEEEVEVCDFCQRTGYLQTCCVCKRQYCLCCQSCIGGCWIGPKVCKACSKREDVLAVVEGHAKQITPIIRARTAALEQLPEEAQ
jgi:non-ribosomal peptide synthetase component E (peptide arylation enzyme)